MPKSKSLGQPNPTQNQTPRRYGVAWSLASSRLHGIHYFGSAILAEGPRETPKTHIASAAGPWLGIVPTRPGQSVHVLSLSDELEREGDCVGLGMVQHLSVGLEVTYMDHDSKLTIHIFVVGFIQRE